MAPLRAATYFGPGTPYSLTAAQDLFVPESVSVISIDATAIQFTDTGDAGPATKLIQVAGLVQTLSSVHAGILVDLGLGRAAKILIEATGIVSAPQGAALIVGAHGTGVSAAVQIINQGIAAGRQSLFVAAGVTELQLLNSGQMSGDVVFEAGTTRLRLTNSGMIDDGLTLGLRNDVVVNKGHIVSLDLGAGNNLYDGRGGKVWGQVTAGTGDDRFIPGAAVDNFVGGGDFGLDTLDFRALGAFRLALDGSIGNRGAARGDTYTGFEQVLGSRFDDFVKAGSDGLVMRGGAGADTLIGDAGQDWLFGGAGRDRLTGGAEEDTFIYTAPADRGDVITDFTGGGTQAEVGKDRFIFYAKAFGLNPNLSMEQMFYAGRSNRAHDRTDRFIFDKVQTKLWFDPDGTGARAPVLIADLQAGAELNRYNLLLDTY